MCKYVNLLNILLYFKRFDIMTFYIARKKKV